MEHSDLLALGVIVGIFLTVIYGGDLEKGTATVRIDPSCVPYSKTITEEFYLIAEGTCLSTTSSHITITCPLDTNSSYLGRAFLYDSQVTIILNDFNRNLISHELTHAWQFLCKMSQIDFADNWTIEGIAGLRADLSEDNPIFKKYEEDWLRLGLTPSQKRELVDEIFTTNLYIDYGWLKNKKNEVLCA